MKHILLKKSVIAMAVLIAVMLVLSGCSSAGAGDGGGGSSDPTVTVNYVSGGHDSGSVPVDEQVYRPGDAVTVRDNAGNLARTGFTFAGWTRGSEGAVVNISPGETFTIGEFDETLIARWELTADASDYTVGLYYYTEDATLTPTAFSVNGEYAGCVDATGIENAVYVGDIIYGETHYLVARHPTGYYTVGISGGAEADTFEPKDVYIELDTDGVHVSYGDNPPAYTIPDGGWPSDCGGGTGGGESTNSIPADVPDDSIGAVDGSDYGYSTFEYWGNWGIAGGGYSGYNTDVFLNPTASGFSPELYFSVFDNSDSIAIDPGTYTLNISGFSPGTLLVFELVGNYDNYGAYSWDYSYAASPLSRADFESISGPIDVYDELVAGSVEVSVSASDEYTFSWRFDTADGQYIEGSYTGPMDATSYYN